MALHLFGDPDPNAPVVVFMPGCAATPASRTRLVQAIQRGLRVAEHTGTRKALEEALEMVGRAMDDSLLERPIIVARAGERPAVWEIPCPGPREAKLYVVDHPPAWLEALSSRSVATSSEAA